MRMRWLDLLCVVPFCCLERMLSAGPSKIRRRSLIGRVMVMDIVLAVALHAFPLLLLPLHAFLELLGGLRSSREISRDKQLLVFELFGAVVLGKLRGYSTWLAIGR